MGSVRIPLDRGCQCVSIKLAKVRIRRTSRLLVRASMHFQPFLTSRFSLLVSRPLSSFVALHKMKQYVHAPRSKYEVYLARSIPRYVRFFRLLASSFLYSRVSSLDRPSDSPSFRGHYSTHHEKLSLRCCGDTTTRHTSSGLMWTK